MDVLHQNRGVAEIQPKPGDQAGKPFTPQPPVAALPARVTGFLVRNRQAVIIAIVGIILLMEIIEHLLITLYDESVHFLFDAVAYTLFVPTLIWFLLSLLESTETKRETAELDNDERAAFSQRLGDASTWDELAQQIVEYTQKVCKPARVTLFVYNQHNARMEPAATCAPNGQVTLRPPVNLSPDSLPIGSLPQLLLQNQGRVTPHHASGPFLDASSHIAPILPPHRYDLPIARNDQVIGVIKVEYPLGDSPTSEVIRELKSVAPIIALALEAGILQSLATEQAEASEKQRQEIAQHLHDTLAQNISYLRLKLDQLTGDNAIREIGMVLEELERMRATADEAYHQVRNTLDELNPAQADDLASVLVRQARTISERSGFSLRSSQVGMPFAMPPATRQQILYIIREAMHNVEKHAQAQRVHLQFLWLENELIVKITDDGVGFNPLQVKSEGHYGLWIMQHRAQELGGSLKIAPAEECGTEVTLWVPRTG